MPALRAFLFNNESFTENEDSIPKELTFASATCGASPK